MLRGESHNLLTSFPALAIQPASQGCEMDNIPLNHKATVGKPFMLAHSWKNTTSNQFSSEISAPRNGIVFVNHNTDLLSNICCNSILAKFAFPRKHNRNTKSIATSNLSFLIPGTQLRMLPHIPRCAVTWAHEKKHEGAKLAFECEVAYRTVTIFQFLKNFLTSDPIIG